MNYGDNGSDIREIAALMRKAVYWLQFIAGFTILIFAAQIWM